MERVASKVQGGTPNQALCGMAFGSTAEDTYSYRCGIGHTGIASVQMFVQYFLVVEQRILRCEVDRVAHDP